MPPRTAPFGPSFGKVIRDLRRRMGLSQEKFAARLHVTVPTIHRWETGKSEPDAPVRHIITQLLAELGPEFADLAAPLDSADSALVQPSRRRRSPSRNGNGPMDNRTMEAMLWSAACSIRGEKDAPKFKDYILPLVFLKRLSDVFDDEITALAARLGDETAARRIVAGDHKLVRFYLPPEASWAVLSGRRPPDQAKAAPAASLGERVTTALRAVARLNPTLQGVVDTADFNQTSNGEREISDAALSGVIETLSDPRHRLGLADVEPDFLGRAYEYLLRKFAEAQGQSAGEFFTPKEVGWLMARLVAPQPGETVYDPCCGSGGLLIKCQLALREANPHPDRPLRLFGQELTGASYALARMNMVIHDMSGEILRGNTMANPKHLDQGRLRTFDIVVTNPMWNQKNIEASVYETDPFGRFEARGGFAPAASADWAWIQHVVASLAPDGRAAVVIDTGAASRGSGAGADAKEKSIRRWFVENGWIEAVVLLPDNLFYNTTAAGIILLLRNRRSPSRRGQVLMINAAAEFTKGRPKNELTDAGMARTIAAFRAWADVANFARPVPVAEIAAADFNLAPSRYIAPAPAATTDDIQTLLDELARCETESAAVSSDIAAVFHDLGFAWNRP